MSGASRFGRQPYKDYEVEEEVVVEPKKATARKAPGTGDFVQVKLPKDLYGPLKVVASMIGESAPSLLGQIVRESLEKYKGMTIEEILQK